MERTLVLYYNATGVLLRERHLLIRNWHVRNGEYVAQIINIF